MDKDKEMETVATAKVRRMDSFINLEAGRVTMSETHGSKVSWKTTLSLAFQSVGIVYGDIGTSPLYVYSSIFTSGIKNNDDILGVLSLIIYTILLIPFLKYVFIVLWANDNGNGGAFALYSLICRHVDVSLIPNQQPEDRKLSNYKLELPSSQLKQSQTLKQMLENSQFARFLLLLATILGTSMVIGDGFLTPSMSVLSAVSGISKSLGQGSEAMFADLGHFNVRAIQISFTLITCPAILCAYTGQAAFLRKFPEKVGNTFYESLPSKLSNRRKFSYCSYYD
ncbi:potassium transporter 5-like [Arachis hypogaea]|uniref:potassium transporter 5-like n=1 Tax=Arachis hypogaea TaxID=3818 RepID=UPI003B214F74